MQSAHLWATATLLLAAVTLLGVVGMVLEFPRPGVWRGCWLGGLLLGVGCARRWELVSRSRPSVTGPSPSEDTAA